MSYHTSEQIREKLAGMERGVGYFDFGKAQCAFALDGYFKVYSHHKFSNQTRSLKEAVSFVRICLS